MTAFSYLQICPSSFFFLLNSSPPAVLSGLSRRQMSVMVIYVTLFLVSSLFSCLKTCRRDRRMHCWSRMLGSESNDTDFRYYNGVQENSACCCPLFGDTSLVRWTVWLERFEWFTSHNRCKGCLIDVVRFNIIDGHFQRWLLRWRCLLSRGAFWWKLWTSWQQWECSWHLRLIVVFFLGILWHCEIMGPHLVNSI